MSAPRMMSSMVGAIEHFSATATRDIVARQLRFAIWLACLALLVGLALVLLARRLSGALVQPLGGWSLTGIAGCLAGIALAVRALTIGVGRGLQSAEYSVLGTQY